MTAGRSLRTLVLIAGCTFVATGATPVLAGGLCGGGPAFIAGGPLYRVGSWRGPRSRLYRHQSGYLLGAQRPYFYNVNPGFAPYGGYGGYGGSGGYGVVALPTADTPCAAYPTPRQSLDCRRERLLQAATRIDPRSDPTTLTPRPTDTTPTLDGAGWTFLRDEQPVKALGRFTAQLMRAPTSGQARIGFALASAMYDDDRTAAAALRAALIQDPAAVRDFLADAALASRMQTLLGRYVDGDDADDAFLAAALHVLLGEDDQAATVLATLTAPDAADDVALATLRTLVEAPAPETLARRE